MDQKEVERIFSPGSSAKDIITYLGRDTEPWEDGVADYFYTHHDPNSSFKYGDFVYLKSDKENRGVMDPVDNLFEIIGVVNRKALLKYPYMDPELEPVDNLILVPNGAEIMEKALDSARENYSARNTI